jgi:hypothetical protein
MLFFSIYSVYAFAGCGERGGGASGPLFCIGRTDSERGGGEGEDDDDTRQGSQ